MRIEQVSNALSRLSRLGRSPVVGPSTVACTSQCYQRCRWGFQLLRIICVLTSLPELRSRRGDHSLEPMPTSFKTHS